MKKGNLNKQIASLERRLAGELDKLENTFIKQVALMRELLQVLEYKRALLNQTKDTGNLQSK